VRILFKPLPIVRGVALGEEWGEANFDPAGIMQSLLGSLLLFSRWCGGGWMLEGTYLFSFSLSKRGIGID
jgi:hypothetical protein